MQVERHKNKKGPPLQNHYNHAM